MVEVASHHFPGAQTLLWRLPGAIPPTYRRHCTGRPVKGKMKEKNINQKNKRIGMKNFLIVIVRV